MNWTEPHKFQHIMKYNQIFYSVVIEIDRFIRWTSHTSCCSFNDISKARTVYCVNICAFFVLLHVFIRFFVIATILIYQIEAEIRIEIAVQIPSWIKKCILVVFFPQTFAMWTKYFIIFPILSVREKHSDIFHCWFHLNTNTKRII